MHNNKYDKVVIIVVIVIVIFIVIFAVVVLVDMSADFYISLLSNYIEFSFDVIVSFVVIVDFDVALLRVCEFDSDVGVVVIVMVYFDITWFRNYVVSPVFTI